MAHEAAQAVCDREVAHLKTPGGLLHQASRRRGQVTTWQRLGNLALMTARKDLGKWDQQFQRRPINSIPFFNDFTTAKRLVRASKEHPEHSGQVDRRRYEEN